MSEFKDYDSLVAFVHIMYVKCPQANGWVLGAHYYEIFVEYAQQNFEAVVAEEMDTLLGLPYIVDTKNPTRIELIQ